RLARSFACSAAFAAIAACYTSPIFSWLARCAGATCPPPSCRFPKSKPPSRGPSSAGRATIASIHTRRPPYSSSLTSRPTTRLGQLPDYKGSDCPVCALALNDPEHVGFTIHRVAEQVDGGAVLHVEHVPIASGNSFVDLSRPTPAARVGDVDRHSRTRHRRCAGRGPGSASRRPFRP